MMRIQTIKTLMLATSIVAVIGLPPALADTIKTNAKPVHEITNCEKDKFEQFLQTQEEWFKRLEKVIVETDSKYTDLAKEMKTRELELLGAKRIAFDYYAKHSPEKLHTDKHNVVEWLVFRNDDKQQLMKENKKFKSLTKKYDWDFAPKDLQNKRMLMLNDSVGKGINVDFRELYLANADKLNAINGIQCDLPKSK
jgi:hypothetical protein